MLRWISPLNRSYSHCKLVSPLGHLGKKFKPRYLRHHYQQNIRIDLQFSKSVVPAFWSCSMHPQTRSVYFRSITGYIPTRQLLFTFSTVPSTLCSMYGKTTDTLRHFLIDCSPKWKILSDILAHYFLMLSISPEMLYSSLRFLHIPHGAPKASIYLSVLSTTLWKLWNLYWEIASSEALTSPISTLNRLLPQIISLTDRLIPKPKDRP
jgi:hypothetical protein